MPRGAWRRCARCRRPPQRACTSTLCSQAAWRVRKGTRKQALASLESALQDMPQHPLVVKEEGLLYADASTCASPPQSVGNVCGEIAVRRWLCEMANAYCEVKDAC